MNVIIVPKDKCPLKVLEEMGNRTRYAWIFLHKSVIKKLRETCDKEKTTETFNSNLFYWIKTEYSPETFLSVEYFSNSWSAVICIKSSDIAFHSPCDNPSEILFFRMAE